MRSRIATILLRAGNPGWYDSLTNIHLTITKPKAYVYEGMNTTNIKTAIYHGMLNVIEGSLSNPTTSIISEEEINNNDTIELNTNNTVKSEDVKCDEKENESKEIVRESEVVEIEETKEYDKTNEEIVEEKPKKTTRKKGTKKEK